MSEDKFDDNGELLKAADSNESLDMPTMWGAQTVVQAARDDARGDWFRESRYAMIIHWGLYSEAAGNWKGRNYYTIAEWLMHAAQIPVKDYEQLTTRFNPTEYDARAWVQLVLDAGMKYIVITSKHHDGFAMFKSAASAYNIVDATQFMRDPLRELADACAEKGVKLGFYYSQFQDWHEADAGGNDWDFAEPRDFDKYLREKAMPQIEELLTNYGPVALIWFDTPGTISSEASEELLALVRRLQPDCMVNSRIGNGLGDYVTLGDQEIPLTAPDCLWETIDTHNDTWGYASYDHNWKSPHELISRLVRLLSLGGNYMLNVGPTGKGVIPEESAIILRKVGDWVHRNAESIYGTSRSPLGRQAWGCSTFRPGTLYLHVLDWPKNGTLRVPGAQDLVIGARLLASGEPLPYTNEANHLCITIPALPADHPVTVIALDLAGFPAAMAETLYVHAGLVNELSAPFATLSACQLGKRSWMEKFGDWHHVDTIEEWADESTAAWTFTALTPGQHYLYADYECLADADYSEFEIILGEQRWTFPVIYTGGGIAGRIRMRHVRLGLITIPEAGNYTLILRACTIKGLNAVLFQQLTLEPLDE